MKDDTTQTLRSLPSHDYMILEFEASPRSLHTAPELTTHTFSTRSHNYDFVHAIPSSPQLASSYGQWFDFRDYEVLGYFQFLLLSKKEKSRKPKEEE